MKHDLKKTDLLDQYAYLYETILDVDRLETSYRIRTLMEHASGESVLEMGIGFGLVTEALSKRFKHVVAIDGSLKVIQQVKNKLAKSDNVSLVHSLFEEYVPEIQFDAVVMFDVLEHVPDPIPVLQRAKEWLTPKGKIQIIVPHAYSFHRRLGRVMGFMKKETDIAESDRERGHYHVYTFDSLRHDIEEAGLVVDLIKGGLVKPLSTRQMAQFSPEVFNGLYSLGMELQEFCSEIYAEARARKTRI